MKKLVTFLFLFFLFSFVASYVLAQGSPPKPTDNERTILELFKNRFGNYIIFENDAVILLIDPKYDPRKAYEPNSKRTQLTNNILQDQMDMMQGGSKTLVALFLIMKGNSFIWPSDWRFEASIYRKTQLLGTLPAEKAFYGIVGPEDKPKWIYLGDGTTQVIIPRADRIIPTPFREVQRIYKIYFLFPGKVKDGDSFREWNAPLNISDVEFKPILVQTTSAQKLSPSH